VDALALGGLPLLRPSAPLRRRGPVPRRRRFRNA
jgi:hypothetical protein